MKSFFANEKKRLTECLLKVPVIDGFEIYKEDQYGFYGWLIMKNGNRISVRTAVLKRAVPLTVTKVIDRLKEEDNGAYGIIMAPYISDASAQICEKARMGFCDASGNCLICVESIYLSVKGNPNKFPQEQYAKTLFNPSASITSLILRELLKDTTKIWKIKYLAEKVGCSIGLVSRVKQYLCEQQWAEMGEKGLRLTDPGNLLEEWSKSYKVNPEQTVLCYTLDEISVFEKKCMQIKDRNGIESFLTGFSGGVRYAPVVRYSRIHLWIHPEDVDEFITFTGCKRVDSGANVVLYVAGNESYFADSREINGCQVVSPVQIYLDCMQLKGRGEEMAEAVLKKEIEK